MSKCWYCNNELTSGDSPKHFGICNKCYDEMFKSGDTIIRSLTNKIAELQKQLERHNKYFNSFSCDSFDEFADFISTFMLTPHEEQTLIKDLEKQLKEKDKKIETLQTHFKKTQELLAREMGGSTIVIDNLQKEMKQALANQKDYYEKKLKSQPAEIVDNIRRELGLKLKYKFNDEVYVLKICNQINEVLDTILKDYQK